FRPCGPLEAFGHLGPAGSRAGTGGKSFRVDLQDREDRTNLGAHLKDQKDRKDPVATEFQRQRPIRRRLLSCPGCSRGRRQAQWSARRVATLSGSTTPPATTAVAAIRACGG